MESARETLVDSIYEAAGDGTKWKSALQTIGEWAGGFAGLFYLINKSTGQFDAIHTGGHSPETELAYVGYYSSIDPHVHVVAKTPEQTWFLSHEHFHDDFYQTDRFFTEFFTPRGARWVTGAKLWEDPQTAAFMAFNKYTDDKPFTAQDRDRLTSFNSHLIRATQLHKKLLASEFNARLGLAAVHALSFGMAVVTGEGLVLMSNLAAEQIIAKTDVFKPSGPNRIGLRNTRDHMRLCQALAEATNGESHAMQVRDSAGKVAAQLTAMPLPAGSNLNTDWQRPLVLLLITEPDVHKQLRPTLMRQLFAITDAETRLANALMEGISPDAYAARHNLSDNTVKTHIKSLLAKTGTCRQAEFVALMSRIPVTP